MGHFINTGISWEPNSLSVHSMGFIWRLSEWLFSIQAKPTTSRLDSGRGPTPYCQVPSVNDPSYLPDLQPGKSATSAVESSVSPPKKAVLTEARQPIVYQPKPPGPTYDTSRTSRTSVDPVAWNCTRPLEEEEKELLEGNSTRWRLPLCGCKHIPLGPCGL